MTGITTMVWPPTLTSWSQVGFRKHYYITSGGDEITGVQFRSFAQSCPTLCDPMDCSTPALPVHHQLLEFTQTHIHWVGDATQPSYPLLSPSAPTFSLSQHQVFSVLHTRWPKYWGLCFSISLSHEYSGLISFRMDRLDLLAVQGALKILLLHHSSKASITAELFQS